MGLTTLSALLLSLSGLFATPASAVDVKLSDGVNVNGGSFFNVENFNAIPYANPPVGDLRLRRPQRFTNPNNITTIDGSKQAPACPQIQFSSANKNIIGQVANMVLQIPLLDELNGQEDCLTLDIARPAGTKEGDKLPVLFWIYGGGFATGSTQSYNPNGIVRFSAQRKQPLIYVAVNYRVGGFGFLSGKQVLKEGVGNLGLLDQRMGLEWVADNIHLFGGDASKVTIWGESAGAISVFDQMLLRGGDSTYKGKPLYRGAIMNSGAALPANPIDSPKGQVVFDTIAKSGGCDTAADPLDCLRKLPFNKYLTATQAAPTLFAFNSEAISYLPRPDGTTLEDSPEVMVAKGKMNAVPMISGNQEDEGTIFALYQVNVTTLDNAVEYMSKNLYSDAPIAKLKEYVSMYEPISDNGSPFRTLAINGLYPGYKRVAAVLADAVFIGPRRAMLKQIAKVKPETPLWAYQSSYNHLLPIVGTFHASDILRLYSRIETPGEFYGNCLGYYSNFVTNLDPNKGINDTAWPAWKDAYELKLFKSDLEIKNTTDDFRSGPLGWIENNLGLLHL